MTDDDIALWPGETARFLDAIPEPERSILVQPQGPMVHRPCDSVLGRQSTNPGIPVTSTNAFISRKLLRDHRPFLETGAIVKLAIEWDYLHDISWGILLGQLQPWDFVQLVRAKRRVVSNQPPPRARQPQPLSPDGISAYVVGVHGVRADDPQSVFVHQQWCANMFASFERGHVRAPSVQRDVFYFEHLRFWQKEGPFLPNKADRLLLKSDCAGEQ